MKENRKKIKKKEGLRRITKKMKCLKRKLNEKRKEGKKIK